MSDQSSNNMDGADSPNDGSNDPRQQHIKLACQACQRKKIKCDRNFPCGQCLRSGLQCAPSQRKPRTRHSGRRALDSELRTRIAKLEGLVETLSGEPANAVVTARTSLDASLHDTEAITSPGGGPPSPTVGKYIGSTFWSQLSGEVQGLRDALEDDPSEDETETQSPNSTVAGVAGAPEYDLLLVPPDHIMVMPGALTQPKPETAQILVESFLKHIEPVVKVFHAPTIKAFLEGGQTYLGYDANSPPARALRAVALFAGLIALSSQDCLIRLHSPRQDLINQYRRRVDVALAQAELITTTDIPTLQASTIFIFALRQADFSRRPWIMTALIIRIAAGMGLEHEVPNASPFNKEIRRRLWHSVRLLDLYAALDRGTPPLVTAGSFSMPLPSNTNDDEFDEKSTSVKHYDTGFTDMTFNMMSWSASTAGLKLLSPEAEGSAMSWQQRLQVALDFGKDLKERYLRFCDMSNPFQRLVHAVGLSMCATCALRAVRPIQRHNLSNAPKVDSPFVMELALNCLRESENTQAATDMESHGYRWFFWTQWHALGIALAGLCVVRGTELAETTWMYVERAYERNARHVADSKSGMLWRPMEKLYKAARAFRAGHPLPLRSASLDSTGMMSAQSSMSPNSEADVFFEDATVHSNGASTVKAKATPGLSSYGVSGMDNVAIMGGMGDGLSTLPDFQGADLNWLDWERIMEDVNTLSAGDLTGQVRQQQQQQPQVQQQLPDMLQQFTSVPQTDWTFSMPANMLGDTNAQSQQGTSSDVTNGWNFYPPRAS